MVAPELVRLDRSGRPGHDERRGRRGYGALLVHGDFRLVHRVVHGHAVRAARQRRQVRGAFEQVSDSHLLQNLKFRGEGVNVNINFGIADGFPARLVQLSDFDFSAFSRVFFTRRHVATFESRTKQKK